MHTLSHALPYQKHHRVFRGDVLMDYLYRNYPDNIKPCFYRLPTEVKP